MLDACVDSSELMPVPMEMDAGITVALSASWLGEADYMHKLQETKLAASAAYWNLQGVVDAIWGCCDVDNIEDISERHMPIIKQVLDDYDDYESVATDVLDAIAETKHAEDIAYQLVQSGKAHVTVSFDGGWGTVTIDGEWGISSTDIQDKITAAAALLEWCPEAPHCVLNSIAEP